MWGVVAGLGCCALGSILVLADEGRAAAAQARLDRAARGDAAGSLIGAIDDADRSVPRAALADALLIARWAQEHPFDGRRGAMLARADAFASSAARSRPDWGEAWTVVAFIRSLGGAVDADLALEQSYRATPYLRHAARWRVHYGLAAYDRLDPTTRSRVADEAVWIARIDTGELDGLMDEARLSDGYRQVLLRWRQARLNDPGWNTAERPAP